MILAAGQGTRMKSALPKVLHEVGGRPMLGHVLDAVRAGGAAACHVVHGHGADAVRAWADAAYTDWDALHWVLQAPQRGTGHAVQQALPHIPDDALILTALGDVPLIRAETLQALATAGAAGLAMVTVELEQPHGYGRILRTAGRVTGVVEEKDASARQRAIREVNVGLFAAPAARMKRWLAALKSDNAQGEFYLTDIVAMAAKEKVKIQPVAASGAEEVTGINDRAQLAGAERVYQRRRAETLMREGLSLRDPGRFDLRGTLRFGRDCEIDVGAVIQGDVTLGDNVSIGPYCVLRNVAIGSGSKVESHCVLDGARLGRDCRIGPFARLRPDAALADEVHVGNFVEVKKTSLGRGSKANHLAYLGDAEIGADVNVGAGTITCNYDGANKHRTVIGDGVFIGSDTQLVAPVTVGAGATIGAGSTITRDVPAGGLTVARARDQKFLPDWKRPPKKS